MSELLELQEKIKRKAIMIIHQLKIIKTKEKELEESPNNALDQL